MSSSSSSTSSPRHLHRQLPHRLTKPTSHADINRILDPAYTRAAVPRAVWVDHQGIQHDPDYRHFPPIPTRDAHAVADDDDDELEPSTPSTFATPDRRRASASSSTSYSHLTHTSYLPAYTFAHYYDEPTSYLSHTGALHESDEHDLDREQVDEGDDCPFASEKRHSTGRARSKSRAPTNRIRKSMSPAMKEARSRSRGPACEKPLDETYTPEKGEADWTPSCSQSLHRQYQSLMLSVRFALFRTRRHIERVFAR